MGFFGFGKKDRVVDLSERYRRQQEEKTINNSRTKASLIETKPIQSSSGMFGMFDSSNSQNQNQTTSMPAEISNPEESTEEKRKKFVKRLTEMTERLDTLSTSLYHLTQRVELLEKKMNVRS